MADGYCIIVNRERDMEFSVTRRVQRYLEAHGKSYTVWTEDPNPEELMLAAREALCAIVLGGDGTVIRAANQLLGLEIPIFGINTGALGYLTGAEAEEAEQGLDRLLSGNCRTERCMMLDVLLNGERRDTVLNDVVINRVGLSRLISIAVYINGALLDVISGDGVLVSTPTGSTGYNLSAGGAIVQPEAQLMAVTPICPHSLTARSIIVSADDEVVLEVRQGNRTQENEAIATLDGRAFLPLSANDRIAIRRSEAVTRLIRRKEELFFETLRRKLGTVER